MMQRLLITYNCD